MSWLEHPIVLEGEKVKLIPLEHAHIPDLLHVASDKRIWEFMGIDGTDKDKLTQFLKSAILKRYHQEQYPFTILDVVTGAIIGSTMFHNIFPEHRKLEIGWTWYDPAYWRTGYNRECKLLLLTYCFERLGTIRVQFQAAEKNLRSCAAIEALGAQREGLLRKDRIRYNGELRNTVMFSILDDEWRDAKKKMMAQNDQSV